jgi:hypothetical protein
MSMMVAGLRAGTVNLIEALFGILVVVRETLQGMRPVFCYFQQSVRTGILSSYGSKRSGRGHNTATTYDWSLCGAPHLKYSKSTELVYSIAKYY